MDFLADMERALAHPPPWSDSPDHEMITNVLLVLGAGVPVLLSLLPMVYLVFSRSLVRTVQLFRTPVMLSSVVNCTIWLLFSIVTDFKKEQGSGTKSAESEGLEYHMESPELIVSYPVVLTSTYISLLLVYFQKKERVKAMVLSLLVLPVICYVVYAARFGADLLEQYKDKIGFLGFIGLLFFHAMTIVDIFGSEGIMDYFLAALNVIPNGCLSGATCYVVSKQVNPSKAVLFASLFGFIGFTLEITVLIMHYIKKNCHGVGDNGDDPHAPAPAQNCPRDQEPNVNNTIQNESSERPENNHLPIAHPGLHQLQATATEPFVQIVIDTNRSSEVAVSDPQIVNGSVNTFYNTASATEVEDDYFGLLGFVGDFYTDMDDDYFNILGFGADSDIDMEDDYFYLLGFGEDRDNTTTQHADLEDDYFHLLGFDGDDSTAQYVTRKTIQDIMSDAQSSLDIIKKTSDVSSRKKRTESENPTTQAVDVVGPSNTCCRPRRKSWFWNQPRQEVA